MIFFNEENYLYFLRKVRKYIVPHCNILAYVLMPNHFHMLIQANERTEQQLLKVNIATNVLSEGIRLLLSAYIKGINKEQNRTGSLIQQNTKSKCVHNAHAVYSKGYAGICFYYIHQNPVKAGLVTRAQDWQYSSYRDYAGLRSGTLCDQQLTAGLLNLPLSALVDNLAIEEEDLEYIW